MLYSPPGEIIECNFLAGNIQDGKIKILVRLNASSNSIPQYLNHEFYEGDLKGNRKSGKGVFYYANGDIYEGEFINDKRVGKGKMTFADQSTIISQFIDD